MSVPTSLNSETQAAPPGKREKAGLGFKQLLYALRQDPRWWCGLVLLLFILIAIFAPILSPYSPTTYNPTHTAQGPGGAHLLGTDELGRDQLSRIFYGTRISLSIAAITILLGGVCGTILGILAAYNKGWIDQVITMLVDALLAFPSLVLALALVTALGPSLVNLVIALAVVRIPIYARIARGQTLQIVAQDYITAARVSGTRTWKILARHIIPNIFSPLLVQATLSISFAILDESVLSFLGLGVQPPTPEWGAMVSEAQPFLRTDPWMMLGPALTIVIVLISLNLFGDAIRDHLDPRTSTRRLERL